MSFVVYYTNQGVVGSLSKHRLTVCIANVSHLDLLIVYFELLFIFVYVLMSSVVYTNQGVVNHKQIYCVHTV